MKSKALIVQIIAPFLLIFTSTVLAQQNFSVPGTDFNAVIEATEELKTTKLEPVETTFYGRVYPKQNWDIGAGMGWVNDTEETRICLKTGYMTRLSQPTEDKNHAWYAGGDIVYDHSNWNDFKTNIFMLGGKLEHHVPLTPTGDIQWLNGIKGHYMFGNRKFEDNKDDIRGWMGCYYTGLQVRISDRLAIGADTAIFSHEDLTFENENGNEFSQDQTEFRLNKANPWNCYLRLFF